MKVGTLLFILHDVTESLVRLGVLDSDGNFNFNDHVETDFKIAAEVVKVLESRGIDFPDKLEKVINALPLIYGLVR